MQLGPHPCTAGACSQPSVVCTRVRLEVYHRTADVYLGQGYPGRVQSFASGCLHRRCDGSATKARHFFPFTREIEFFRQAKASSRTSLEMKKYQHLFQAPNSPISLYRYANKHPHTGVNRRLAWDSSIDAAKNEKRSGENDARALAVLSGSPQHGRHVASLAEDVAATSLAPP